MSCHRSRRPILVWRAARCGVAGLQLASGVCVYRFTNGQTWTVTLDGAQVAIGPTGENPVPMPAESETRFFIRSLNVVIDFVRDGAGNVTELVMLPGTRQERLTRET